MMSGKRIAVVMPAYNAERTLEKTWRGIPAGAADDVIVVDDASTDRTVEVARGLGLRVIERRANGGYGANQKTCYEAALARGADVVVMLHPDFQYDPGLVAAIAAPVAGGAADVCLGSRMLAGGAVKGGMPLHRYAANRVLTAFQNFFLGASLSEYHTGYRAYSRDVLERLPFATFSDDFIFDNEMLVAALARGSVIAEIPCPTRYDRDSSSISFHESVRYALGVIGLTLRSR